MDLNNYIQMLIQSGIKFGHCECNSSHWIVSECFDYNDNNSMVITQFTTHFMRLEENCGKANY